VQQTEGLPPWAISALKWAGAILALLLIVNYAAPRAWQEIRTAIVIDSGDDDELPEADAAATEPTSVEEGEVTAVVDLATRNGTITGRSAETIALGGEGAEQLLIGFDRVPADPACLTEVFLEVYLVESTQTELFVRPAALAEIAELEDGQGLPPDAVIEGSTPSVAVAAQGSSGWLRWDVLGPYTLSHRSASSEAPVVLSLAGPEDGNPERSSVFATTDGAADTVARLRWAAVEPCSELGRGGGVEEEDPALREEAVDAGAEDDGGEADGVDPDEPAAEE
jgi:hypothetical protein